MAAVAGRDQSLGERVAAVEIELKHVATKADITRIEATLNTLKWVLAIAIPAAIALTGLIVTLIVTLITR